jgi:hypothetical protein
MAPVLTYVFGELISSTDITVAWTLFLVLWILGRIEELGRLASYT